MVQFLRNEHIVICNIRHQLHFLILFRNTKYILLGTSNQIKSNTANPYYFFYIQVQVEENVGSYQFSGVKWLAHLFYNRARRHKRVKTVIRIVAKTNIAILTI